VTRSYDASLAKQESWVRRVNNFRIGYRVNFIHADYFRITTKQHFISATYNVQMSDANVVSDYQLLDADKNIQVTDCNIIVDLTLRRVDDAQSDMNVFANPISKKQAIDWTL